jgi:hypothetical protein
MTMGIYMSSPQRIDTLFDEIGAEPDNESYLAMEFRENLVKNMRSQTLDEEFVKNWLDEIETDHPMLDGIRALCGWVYHEDFDSAQAALTHFSDALYEAMENDWSNLTVFNLEQLVALNATLGGHTPCDELKTAVDVLEADYEGADVHHGNASILLQLIIENKEKAANETLQQALEYCQEQASTLHDDENFYSERNRLGQAITLARDLGRNVADLESRIVDSWDTQLDTEYEGGSTRDLILVGKAMQDCQDFAPSSKLDEWKQDMQEIATQAVEGMTEVEHSVGIEHSVIDALVDGVEALDDRESPVFALFSIAYFRPHVREVEKRDIDQPDSFRDAFNHVKVSELGTAGGTDYRTEEELEAVLMEQILTDVFRECFDRGVISGGSVIDLVERFAGLEEEDINYFNELVDHYANEEYIAAYHIGTPHFERVLLKMLNAKGESIIALKPDGTITSALGTLFEKLGAYTDTAYAEHLQYKYTERGGQNRRNLAAHGLVSYDQVDTRLTTGLLLDLLAVGCDLNHNGLVSELGDPEIPPGW